LADGLTFNRAAGHRPLSAAGLRIQNEYVFFDVTGVSRSFICPGLSFHFTLTVPVKVRRHIPRFLPKKNISAGIFVFAARNFRHYYFGKLFNFLRETRAEAPNLNQIRSSSARHALHSCYIFCKEIRADRTPRSVLHHDPSPRADAPTCGARGLFY